MEELFAGLPWILVTVLGIAALGIALAYGTGQWRQRRLDRPRGTVGRAPGPAPEGSRSGPDDRRAA